MADQKRALVISGGGSKGAFAGGIAEYLLMDCGNHYDIFVGTSTGSLMVPLLSIKEIDKLKKIYTSVTQDDIFSICPFTIKKVNGIDSIKINHFNTVKMFLKGANSFGESKNLRKLIADFFTVDDYQNLITNKADVIVTVSNLSTNQVEYKSVKDCSYDDFCDWMWASSNIVPFMSLVEKEGFEYADGGLGNIVPIYEAIRKGATQVDVIVLKSEQPVLPKKPVINALDLTARAFDFMLNQIVIDDIIIGRYEGLKQKVDLHFYRPQQILTDNALIFNPDKMKIWWEQGYEFAKYSTPISQQYQASR